MRLRPIVLPTLTNGWSFAHSARGLMRIQVSTPVPYVTWHTHISSVPQSESYTTPCAYVGSTVFSGVTV